MRPWRTLEYAARHARPGLAIHVAPGRYVGRLHIERGGTRARPVRFVAERRWRSRLVAPQTIREPLVTISADHVRFEGFDVSGNAAAGIEVDGNYDIVAGNYVHDLAIPCDRPGHGGAGIVVGGGSNAYRNHDALVAANVVSRVGAAPRNGTCRLVHGIYAAVPQVTIVNNVVSESAGDGITSWHAARALRISNNLSAANAGAGILVGSGDTGATRSGNVGTLVSNNIVSGNFLRGIVESSDQRHPVGPGNSYLNNLSFANNNGHETDDPWEASLYPGETTVGNLHADPLLTGALPRTPRLSPVSPCVDAGTAAGAPPRDFYGTPRPQGRAVDIGPLEIRRGMGPR